MKTLKTFTEHQAIYLAGLFDGEGYIAIHSLKRKGPTIRQFQLMTQVTNTHKGVMDWIVENIGGTLAEGRPYGNRARYWKWTLQCDQAARMLRAMRPFLIVKAEQADVALAFQDHIRLYRWQKRKGQSGNCSLRQELLDARQAYADRLREIRAADKQYS